VPETAEELAGAVLLVGVTDDDRQELTASKPTGS
jgi:hypothetical protein